MKKQTKENRKFLMTQIKRAQRGLLMMTEEEMMKQYQKVGIFPLYAENIAVDSYIRWLFTICRTVDYENSAPDEVIDPVIRMMDSLGIVLINMGQNNSHHYSTLEYQKCITIYLTFILQYLYEQDTGNWQISLEPKGKDALNPIR